MKKLICTFLALILAALCFAGCAGNKTPVTSGDTNGSLPGSSDVTPDIPVIDFDGRDFNVYGETQILQTFFYADEPGTEIIGKAKYTMISNIEERYGISVNITDSGIVGIPHVTQIQAMIDSGQCDYQLVEMHDVLGTGVALTGYCANLKNVKYLDFEKPWWHNVDELMVNGSVYMITTDMSYLDIATTWCLYFNKTLMNDMQIEYPYQSVIDGTWTIDELIKITKDVYVDDNRNNEVDSGDIYGISVGYSMYGWMDSLGVPMVVKNSEGRLVVTDRVSEVSAAAEKVLTWLSRNVGATTSGLENTYDRDGFENGRYMIFQNNLRYSVDSLRFIDDFEYGILPIPKYSENQEYISTSMSYPFWIPNCQSADELEYTGLITEALSAEGYKVLTPAYYETALKRKYNPSDIDAQVITIIHENRHPDISRYYDNGGTGMYNILYELNKAGSTDVMSYYDSKKDTTQQLLDWWNEEYGLG